MTKLNQIVAIETSVKANANRTFTTTYQQFQSPAPFNGIARVYRAKDEEGETLPPESTLVQAHGEKMLDVLAERLGRFYDIAATKDLTNTHAKADIVVDGQVIVPGVPVTTLLWLEKQLIDLSTTISKLPTLDPGIEWEYDDSQAAYRSKATETVRTKKVPRVLVKAPATDKHQADTEVYHEDVPVGTWQTIRYSGAFPRERVNALAERILALQAAVRVAREEANLVEVTDMRIGGPIFHFLFSR